ncbi:MAG TPA: GerMN domain-containing protein [Spirochaetales bacterium]|nr:GerMN domain-containing protein [Spirochaetales bacterium]HRY55730.1 GerMN domain-containing protein [Spirochaetia bacterium]HRZ65376.1 GerMN domain-containing protein [Spirochaetia bacterium]
MKPILEACGSALRRAAAFLRKSLRLALEWLSHPAQACAAALAFAFAFSLLFWAVADRRAEMTLFFPIGPAYASDRGLGAELRDLPRPRGPEARAELAAEELLLGPRDPSLHEAFPRGVRLETAIYRKGRLYIDLSEDAALAEPASLKLGLVALRRTVKAALPGLKSLTVTIGGREPYAEALEAGNGAKKQKNN